MKVLHLKFRRTPGDAELRLPPHAHVHVQMFSALVTDAIDDPTVGLCGEVTMRWEEWEELETILKLSRVTEDLRISLARP
jgi:hypothetical protein